MEVLSWVNYFLLWCAGFVGSVIWAKIYQPKIDYKFLAILNIILVFPIVIIFAK